MEGKSGVAVKKLVDGFLPRTVGVALRVSI